MIVIKSKERKETLKYVGDLSQLLGIKKYTLNDGKSKGVRALDIKNGKGLQLTVLPDKCMDIPYLSYKGTNIGFVSKTGIVAPEYYVENEAKGFLDSFNAGFLTTCGLTHIGTPCIEDGKALGLHGPIANTPAEDVSAFVDYSEETAKIKVSGKMRQTSVFEENLTLSREIVVDTEKNSMGISDIVENLGFETQPLMFLHHFNFGYPILSEDSTAFFGTEQVTPRDNNAAKGIDNYNSFEKPVIGYDEQVFYHTMKSNNEDSFALIYNKKLGLAVVIEYNAAECPWLIEWKCMRAGDYALGLEPSNCHVGGRETARADGNLKFIEAGAVNKFDFEIKILDDISEIEEYMGLSDLV